MSQYLRVLWTIRPLIAPRPWLPCSTCGEPKPFHSSGKIRLNANGKRLDAWLIYRCIDCDATWNRPIFERQSVRALDPALLAAASDSDPDFVRSHAFDMDGLARHARHIETFPDVAVQKRVTGRAVADAMRLWIRLSLASPMSVRLDRLLASELGLSRSHLSAIADRGHLSTEPERKQALRRPPQDGMRIGLDLAGEGDAAAILKAAAGAD